MAINRLTRRGPVAGAEPDLLENVEGRVRGLVEEIERTEAKAELHGGPRAGPAVFYFAGMSRSRSRVARPLPTNLPNRSGSSLVARLLHFRMEVHSFSPGRGRFLVIWNEKSV